MIVPDASFVLHFLLKASLAPVVADIIAGAERLAAPALVDYEVLSALRRLALAREISPQRAETATAAFYRMSIDRHPMEPFVERIWSMRSNATVYDAAYIALAERLEAPLYTLDQRLTKVPGHAAVVIAV